MAVSSLAKRQAVCVFFIFLALSGNPLQTVEAVKAGRGAAAIQKIATEHGELIAELREVAERGELGSFGLAEHRSRLRDEVGDKEMCCCRSEGGSGARTCSVMRHDKSAADKSTVLRSSWGFSYCPGQTKHHHIPGVTVEEAVSVPEYAQCGESWAGCSHSEAAFNKHHASVVSLMSGNAIGKSARLLLAANKMNDAMHLGDEGKCSWISKPEVNTKFEAALAPIHTHTCRSQMAAVQEGMKDGTVPQKAGQLKFMTMLITGKCDPTPAELDASKATIIKYQREQSPEAMRAEEDRQARELETGLENLEDRARGSGKDDTGSKAFVEVGADGSLNVLKGISRNDAGLTSEEIGEHFKSLVEEQAGELSLEGDDDWFLLKCFGYGFLFVCMCFICLGGGFCGFVIGFFWCLIKFFVNKVLWIFTLGNWEHDGFFSCWGSWIEAGTKADSSGHSGMYSCLFWYALS